MDHDDYSDRTDAPSLAPEDMPGYEVPDPRPGEDDVDDAERCDCCDGLPGCGCDIYDYYEVDRETGPQGGTICDTHRRHL